MANQRTWKVYDCDLVDMAETNPEAEALPKGFATRVLLDYDFSDDEQVLAFARRYGPVACPYGGAIFRTTMTIENPPRYYPQALSQAAFIRGRDGGTGGQEEADLLRRGVCPLSRR